MDAVPPSEEYVNSIGVLWNSKPNACVWKGRTKPVDAKVSVRLATPPPGRVSLARKTLRLVASRPTTWGMPPMVIDVSVERSGCQDCRLPAAVDAMGTGACATGSK